MKWLGLVGLILPLAAANAAQTVSSSDIQKFFDLGYRAKSTTPVSDQNVVLPQYQNAYANKVDFARLEHKMPLDTQVGRQFLTKLTSEQILGLDQELVDQLYARLRSGPIPDGIYDGQAKISKGSSFANTSKLFVGMGAGAFQDILDGLIAHLWKGKRFYKDQKLLRNLIPPDDVVGKAFGVIVKGFDYTKLPIVTDTVDGKPTKMWELFPAKLYCGQSLMDSRRESVIIDYAYGDEIDGYNDTIDFLATRNGLYVRDEIRMVHPGLYLGKAYLGRMYFLTFVLENKDVEAKLNQPSNDWAGMQECWPGTQQVSTR